MIRCIILICCAVFLASCGTVVRGTKQGVRFESTPSGAEVKVVRAKKRKTEWHCVSPCELQLSRKRDFDVTFELKGYKTVTARLASRLGAKGGATAIPGNFVLGGGVGFIVDAGTGANMQLKPDPMRAKLAALGDAEDSVVFDVRVEGGGVEDIHAGEDEPKTTVPTDTAALGAAGATQLKRLPREFGAKGVPVSNNNAVTSQMNEAGGIQLTQVDPNGAAARAGIRVGDIVKSINSNRVSTMDDINNHLGQMLSGDTASIVIWRDRELYEANLEI